MFNPIKLHPNLARPSNQNKCLESGLSHWLFLNQLIYGRECVKLPLSTSSTDTLNKKKKKKRTDLHHILSISPHFFNLQTVKCLTEKKNHKIHHIQIPHFIHVQTDAQDN